MITKADVAAVRTAATLHAGDPDNGRLARELNRAAERMEDQLFLESRPLHASSRIHVHWITTGVTRVTARIPAAARAALFDYPFSDNADATEVVDVVETIPAELP